MVYVITIYSIGKDSSTKETCWNTYNSEWLGKAYTQAYAKRFGVAVISHVKHKAGGSKNFTAEPV